MTQEGGTPPGFWERVEQIAERVVARYARSGPLQNASISDGGLTIKGGFLKVVASMLGVNLMYVGPMSPNQVDGSPQQGLVIRRADGTVVMAMYDAFPSADGLRQALNWHDRSGNSVFADDTESGQGMARPYLSGGFAAAQFANYHYSTTSASFVTLAETFITKQQPELLVYVRASMDTTATTGELRVMVNSVQLGATAAHTFAINGNTLLGPVAGNHMDLLRVEIQGRVTGGAGALRVEPVYWEGRQS